LFVRAKVYTPNDIRVASSPNQTYKKRNREYRIAIVHASPSLPFPAEPNAHAQNTCQRPLRIGGNPPLGIKSCTGPGRAPVGIRLVIELIVGITTPGCVRNTTRPVPPYP